MINKKILFLSVILLILIINASFILAQEIEISEEIASFDSEKVDYKVFSEYGEEITQLSFTEGGFVEIKGNRFENIQPASKSLNPSYIKIDNLGNILEADLTANEQGSTFLINGLTLKVPPESRVFYNNKDKFYLENADILDVKKDQFISLPITGGRINFFNELFLDSGEVSLQEEGYLIEDGYKIVYKNIQITPKGFNKFLIEKNLLRDLSAYEENFIQNTENGLKIQSRPDTLGFNLRFLEGNEIFDITPSFENKESFLSMDISGGDKLELIKKDFIIKGTPPLIKHKSSEQGETIIKNGKHIFKFEDGKYISELGNLNTKNKLSVNFNLDSDVLGTKTISVDEDNGYSIFELGKGNIFTFNKALLNKPNYNFESEIGKKVYSYAEEQIGESAFVSEGRGECYGGKELKVKGFDCIGLGISSLINVYPDSSLRAFSPNLKLVNELKQKGWSSSVLEPSSIQGEEKTAKAIKDISPGSIVFLMHTADKEDLIKDYGSKNEGIVYQKHLNSNNKEVFLNLGHALIRGTGEKNFINANPNVFEEDLPLRAIKINENLEKQGKFPIFIGSVREGEMVPEYDYLIVISPPED